MKFFTLVIFLATLSIGTIKAQTIAIGTTNPDSSALFELKSSNKGFLPIRVALKSTMDTVTIKKPATALLVYNTAESGTDSFKVHPGYYYWQGGSWHPLVDKGKAIGDMQYWDGQKWVNISIGPENSVLTVCNGIPVWGGCKKIFTYSPNNNPDEVLITSNIPNTVQWGYSYFWAGAWTIGDPVYGRFLIKFNLSDIPASAIIDSARLTLYSVSPVPVGNQSDAMYGSANSCYIQRITSNWTGNATTWNNQPSITTVNQAIVPKSNFSSEDSKNLDVTELVKDMLSLGNYGFLVKLQAENYYNIRQYSSSYNSDASKHYQLTVYLH